MQELKKKIDHVLAQYADQIEPINAKGRVAVVQHEVDPRSVAALNALGWNGIALVFSLGPARVSQALKNCAEVGDNDMISWLCRSGTSRVLLVMHHERLLLTRTSDGWSLEPSLPRPGRPDPR